MALPDRISSLVAVDGSINREPVQIPQLCDFYRSLDLQVPATDGCAKLMLVHFVFFAAKSSETDGRKLCRTIIVIVVFQE